MSTKLDNYMEEVKDIIKNNKKLKQKHNNLIISGLNNYSSLKDRAIEVYINIDNDKHNKIRSNSDTVFDLYVEYIFIKECLHYKIKDFKTIRMDLYRAFEVLDTVVKLEVKSNVCETVLPLLHVKKVLLLAKELRKDLTNFIIESGDK